MYVRIINSLIFYYLKFDPLFSPLFTIFWPWLLCHGWR